MKLSSSDVNESTPRKQEFGLSTIVKYDQTYENTPEVYYVNQADNSDAAETFFK